MAVLDRWEDWKTTRDNAAQIPDMEQRIADIEEKIGGKWPGDVCPKCGRQSLRVIKAHRVRTGRGTYKSLRSYACEHDGCDFREQRQV